MSVLDKLSSSLKTRVQVPNQELAKQIVKKNDKKAIVELVENLDNKNKTLQGDCIKTLHEIGELKPALIAGYAKDFIKQLDSKNNRMQWGAMCALDAITEDNLKLIYSSLLKLLDVAEKGSVITNDHFVRILTKLCKEKSYYKNVFPILLEQIKKSPVNQLPMYVEVAAEVVNDSSKSVFLKTVESRMKDVEQESKRKRLLKVIKIIGGKK